MMQQYIVQLYQLLPDWVTASKSQMGNTKLSRCRHSLCIYTHTRQRQCLQLCQHHHLCSMPTCPQLHLLDMRPSQEASQETPSCYHCSTAANTDLQRAIRQCCLLCSTGCMLGQRDPDTSRKIEDKGQQQQSYHDGCQVQTVSNGKTLYMRYEAELHFSMVAQSKHSGCCAWRQQHTDRDAYSHTLWQSVLEDIDAAHASKAIAVINSLYLLCKPPVATQS